MTWEVRKRDLVFEAQARFDNAFPPHPYADFGWAKIPETFSVKQVVYVSMLREFSASLSNGINELLNGVRWLEAWAATLEGLPDDHKFELLTEYIHPRATLALLLPYTIRSRFIFAVAHLCHQANRSRTLDWQDDLAEDREIQFCHANLYGRPWRSYGKLQIAMEGLASRSYAEATRDFRNRYAHRFPPQIEMGLDSLMPRKLSQGKIRYAYGGSPPLSLTMVANLSMNQAGLALAALDRFKALVSEHSNTMWPDGR